jgi:hypothetical protein
MHRNKIFIIGCVIILLFFAYTQYIKFRTDSVLADQTIDEVHSIDVITEKID